MVTVVGSDFTCKEQSDDVSERIYLRPKGGEVKSVT